MFCLLKLDGQVLDTALVETDESETDISFDNIIVLYVFTLCLQVLQLVVCVQYFENSKGASLNCSRVLNRRRHPAIDRRLLWDL